MTRRILITIEYDGGPFVGWQRQDNGPSVQTAIEDAAKAFIHAPVAVVGAGRTDAGVHATGQAAHIDVPEKFTANRVMEALNSHLSSVPITNSRRIRSAGGFSCTLYRYRAALSLPYFAAETATCTGCRPSMAS